VMCEDRDSLRKVSTRPTTYATLMEVAIGVAPALARPHHHAFGRDGGSQAQGAGPVHRLEASYSPVIHTIHHEFLTWQCGPGLGGASQHGRPISIKPGWPWSLRGLGWSGPRVALVPARSRLERTRRGWRQILTVRRLTPTRDCRARAPMSYLATHRGVEAGRLVGKNLDSDAGSGTGSHNERQCARATKITANCA
jgi:hypothetical protein